MLSINNNNCDYSEREMQVIELYDQGKTTRSQQRRILYFHCTLRWYVISSGSI
jgi:hypothetical protein